MASESSDRSDSDPERIAKYNAAYSAQDDFIHAPNAFLATCLTRISGAGGMREGATALDVGIGQGRNALLLARAGYDTVGIDFSAVGVDAVQCEVKRLGVTNLRAEVADATKYDFGCERWDVVTLLYYPLPMLIIERLKRAVRPGGHIIMERFTQKLLEDVGPDAEEGRRVNPMLGSLSDWHLLHYEHDVHQSDWHWKGESPTGLIVRALARKPG